MYSIQYNKASEWIVLESLVLTYLGCRAHIKDYFCAHESQNKEAGDAYADRGQSTQGRGGGAPEPEQGDHGDVFLVFTRLHFQRHRATYCENIVCVDEEYAFGVIVDAVGQVQVRDRGELERAAKKIDIE